MLFLSKLLNCILFPASLIDQLLSGSWLCFNCLYIASYIRNSVKVVYDMLYVLVYDIIRVRFSLY